MPTKTATQSNSTHKGLGSVFGFHDVYHNQFRAIFPDVTYQLGMTY